ncbi:MAG: signal peptide peptidase SppA [Candidatus Binataceae bacterium]
MGRRILRWIVRAAVTLVVMAVIAAILDYTSHRVASGTVLMVKLEGPISERGSTSVMGAVRGGHETPLNIVRRAIDHAIRDSRIEGLVIEVIDPTMELAQAQELSGLIKKFAASGRWTSAYIETAGEFEPGNLDYMVASAAGEVAMMPRGELNLIGVQMRELFIRGTLDWIGVKPNIDAIGVYKSAKNLFTEKTFTAAQREEDDALVGDFYQQLVNQIGAQRHLDAAAVRAIIDRAPLDAPGAIKARLVDKLEYEDEFNDRIKHRGGKEHAVLDYANYERPRILPSFSHPEKIAVIYGTGEIDRGSGGFDPLLSPGGTSMGSDTMVDAFKAAREDDAVRAVVFRINSPGGSVIASELIRRQVELTASKKPVVVSMSSYAASGGYWVATPAKKIIADPGTVTGSIGVLGGKFTIAEAAAKLGVTTGAVARGQNVTIFDQFTDFTPEQQKLLQDQLLGSVYQDFVKRVADSRHLTIAQVEKIAQGRVWTGEQAFDVKLVDTLGDFDAALKEAKAEAKLPVEKPVQIEELPEQPGLFEQLLGGLSARAEIAAITARMLAPLAPIIRAELANRGAMGALYCSRVPIM